LDAFRNVRARRRASSTRIPRTDDRAGEMMVTFDVRDPIGVNRAYARNAGAGGDRHLTKVGADFKTRVREAALVAARNVGWPSPYAVVHARLSYQLVNYRGDVDGPAKLLRDACEGVLYSNDREVEDGLHPLPIKDDGLKRVCVTVELFATCDPAEAAAREAHADAIRARRAIRPKRTRSPKPRGL
jgi:hypothetical protein